jgi:hypothetical protein
MNAGFRMDALDPAGAKGVTDPNYGVILFFWREECLWESVKPKAILSRKHPERI